MVEMGLMVDLQPESFRRATDKKYAGCFFFGETTRMLEYLSAFLTEVG